MSNVITLESLVEKYYRQFLESLGTPETQQQEIRFHHYAVGYLLGIFKPLPGNAINLRGETLKEHAAHLEEIIYELE